MYKYGGKYPNPLIDKPALDAELGQDAGACATQTFDKQDAAVVAGRCTTLGQKTHK